MALPCLRGSVSNHVARCLSAQLLCSSFSTSLVMEASVKKPTRKVTQKKKTPMKRGGSSGPRSSKQRSSGTVDAGTGISTSNAFLGTPIKMSQLPEFVPENATPENLHRPMAWTKRTLEATRIQGFGLTREIAKQFKATPRPRSVLRQASLDLFNMLDKSGASSSSSSNMLLQGSTGSGTSTLLLQCFSYALESSWIVIYIPRTINLVDSSSPFSYNEALQTYLQPELARDLLKKILENNENGLSKLTAGAESIKMDGGLILEPHTSLTKAIQMALKLETTAAGTQQILELILKTIVQQKEIPVLMAIDGAQALFSTSRYRDADYELLQSYELAVPRLLQACLRKDGPGSFGGVQRGKALAAFSLQHSEWPVPLEVKAGMRLQSIDAYAKLDEIMLGIVEDCRFDTMEIASALTIDEAVSLAELARDEGGRWTPISDEFFMSKLVESGGSIGTFDRSLRKSTL